MKYWASFSIGLEFQLPKEAIDDCHHQGACDADVEYWQKELNLNLDRKLMIRELLEYGAWSVRELCALSNAELEHKILWIASGNIQDDMEHEYNQGENND